MKLSVIIVSYNEKKYLSEAIESCLGQAFNQSYEIIIGDDGSDDGSLELIQEYAQKRPDIVKWFVMDRLEAIDVIPSIRVSNVLKRAFSMALGDYFMVMSGDDILCSRYKFSRQIEFLERNPKYSSCYTDFKRFWDNGEEMNFILRSSIKNPSFWSKRYVHISCFIYRREVLKYILGRFCDDTGLNFSILKAGKSKHIQGIMFGYRQRNTSIMHEADKLELYILEVSLFQDILNHGGYLFSSFSRFAKPLLYVYQHRAEIENKKYEKYLRSGSMYDHDLLGQIKNYDKSGYRKKLKLQIFLWKGIVFKFYFSWIRKLDTLFNIILKN